MKLQSLASEILSRPCPHKLRLVAIDGGAGAGKTTLAAQLSQALGKAPILKMDDFISFRTLTEFWPRMERDVLGPLFEGRPARYQVRDWVGDMHGEGLLPEPVETPFAPVILLEGVGASRKELTGRLHYAIWVETPEDERLRRGLERDAGIEGIREIWLKFQVGERAFLEADGARERADLILDGRVPIED